MATGLSIPAFRVHNRYIGARSKERRQLIIRGDFRHMRSHLLAAALLCLMTTTTPAHADALSDAVQKDMPSLITLYKDLHAHPELSMHETRSEEHTSELQSLMRISYAVFCLKKKKKTH